MIRYAAISTSGHRFRSDSRHDVDCWCAEQVKAGEACEVYIRADQDAMGRPHGGIELIGRWEPIVDAR